MPIFGKKPDSEPVSSTPKSAGPPRPAPSQRPRPQQAPRPASAPKRSFLGEGCEFEGDLRGQGSFECGGAFKGTIDVEEDLVIGHGGVATAQIKARRINIEGRLEGDAIGGEKVEVGASGHVEGDVRAPAVQFAEGAFFEGNVEMRRGKNKDAAPEATEENTSDAGARDDNNGKASGGESPEAGQDSQ